MDGTLSKSALIPITLTVDEIGTGEAGYDGKVGEAGAGYRKGGAFCCYENETLLSSVAISITPTCRTSCSGGWATNNRGYGCATDAEFSTAYMACMAKGLNGDGG